MDFKVSTKLIDAIDGADEKVLIFLDHYRDPEIVVVDGVRGLGALASVDDYCMYSSAFNTGKEGSVVEIDLAKAQSVARLFGCDVIWKLDSSGALALPV